jgi:hypothetical protein
MNEADRYSLDGLRNIHREMDDDQDGGIEVEESVEVRNHGGGVQVCFDWTTAGRGLYSVTCCVCISSSTSQSVCLSHDSCPVSLFKPQTLEPL